MDIKINMTGLDTSLGNAATGTFLATAIVLKAIAEQTNSTAAVHKAIVNFLAVETAEDNIVTNLAKAHLISIQDSFSPLQNSAE